MFCAKAADGTYRDVNNAFVRRTGRTSKREVIGHTASEIFSEERAAHYEDQDRSVLETLEPLRDELELIRRPDGSLGWYLTTKVPVPSTEDPKVAAGLVSVSRDLRTPTGEGIAVESLQAVVTHVRTNISTAIKPDHLAEVAGCSRDQLDRRLRRVFGLSATQYILRVRVDHAMGLLHDTDKSIAEIAADVGFYDQPEFTRRFARLTGRTPAQFRAMPRDRTEETDPAG